LIKYPNGKLFLQKIDNSKDNRKKSKDLNYANRGMSLEEDINVSNEYYLQTKKAVIHKKPTPIQIVKVDYQSRSTAKITEAYFRTPSTLDYNGIYKGKYLDFDAKETKNKTSFPLKNFHEHQIQHMEDVLQQQGICFAIIRFSSMKETFLLDAKHIIQFWKEKERGGRKSIPFSYIKEHGYPIKEGYQPRLDYLAAVEKAYLS
jgi:recombination protein U